MAIHTHTWPSAVFSNNNFDNNASESDRTLDIHVGLLLGDVDGLEDVTWTWGLQHDSLTLTTRRGPVGATDRGAALPCDGSTVTVSKSTGGVAPFVFPADDTDVDTFIWHSTRSVTLPAQSNGLFTRTASFGYVNVDPTVTGASFTVKAFMTEVPTGQAFVEADAVAAVFAEWGYVA